MLPGAHDERHDESNPSRDSPLRNRAEHVSGKVEECGGSSKKALLSNVMIQKGHNYLLMNRKIRQHPFKITVRCLTYEKKPLPDWDSAPSWLCIAASLLIGYAALPLPALLVRLKPLPGRRCCFHARPAGGAVPVLLSLSEV